MKEYGISREDVYDDAFGQEIPGDTEIEVEDGGTTNVITILAEMGVRDLCVESKMTIEKSFLDSDT